MEHACHDFEENRWVSVLPPAFMRHHRLAIVDSTFAHTYCGKIFDLRDLILVSDHGVQNKCPRCAAINIDSQTSLAVHQLHCSSD